MYCGSCLRDNAMATELIAWPRRDALACLHTHAHRRTKRQQRSRRVGRHQRIPRTVRTGVSQDTALARSNLGLEKLF